MRKLFIRTRYCEIVYALLRYHELVENGPLPLVHQIRSDPVHCMEIAYPDDVLSQSLTFWLALAQGCGLIEGYSHGVSEREP